MSSDTHTDISIIVPVKNEIQFIRSCLQGIFSQSIGLNTEVILIDSGSTDGTLKVVAEFPNVHVITIPPEDFGHGSTRNLGAAAARGEWLVFLNADAVPHNSQWLFSLIKPMQRDSQVVGVFSRHIPQKNCHYYMERDLLRAMPEGIARVIDKRKSLGFFDFSTVSGAMRRAVWEKFPFRKDIVIAEDQEWAGRILAAGYKIIYEPRSKVIHSHNYSFRGLFHIKKEVAASSSYFFSRILAVLWGLVLCLGGFFFKCCGDLLFILQKRSGVKVFFVQLGISFAARAASFCGRYAGWVKGAGRE